MVLLILVIKGHQFSLSVEPNRSNLPFMPLSGAKNVRSPGCPLFVYVLGCLTTAEVL